MKKAYISPSVSCVEIENKHIIAASTTYNIYGGTTVNGTDAQSRENNIDLWLW